MARTAALLICLAALAAGALAAPEHSFRQVALSEGRSLEKGHGNILDKLLDIVQCAGDSADEIGAAIEDIVENVRESLSQIVSLKGDIEKCKRGDIECYLVVAKSASEDVTSIITDLIGSLQSAKKVKDAFETCMENLSGATTPAPSN